MFWHASKRNAISLQTPTPSAKDQFHASQQEGSSLPFQSTDRERMSGNVPKY